MILDATFLAIAAKAVLIEYEEEEIWIPLSQIENEVDFSDYRREDPIQLEITDWIADKKGLL